MAWIETSRRGFGAQSLFAFRSAVQKAASVEEKDTPQGSKKLQGALSTTLGEIKGRD